MPEAVVYQAEAALLSAVFNYPDSIVLAAEYVKPQDFSDSKHQRIFQACLDVDRCGIPIDITTMKI